MSDSATTAAKDSLMLMSASLEIEEIDMLSKERVLAKEAQ